jgi:hypothetical protein
MINGPNIYLYASNDPVNGRDPSGLDGSMNPFTASFWTSEDGTGVWEKWVPSPWEGLKAILKTDVQIGGAGPDTGLKLASKGVQAISGYFGANGGKGWLGKSVLEAVGIDNPVLSTVYGLQARTDTAATLLYKNGSGPVSGGVQASVAALVGPVTDIRDLWTGNDFWSLLESGNPRPITTDEAVQKVVNVTGAAAGLGAAGLEGLTPAKPVWALSPEEVLSRLDMPDVLKLGPAEADSVAGGHSGGTVGGGGQASEPINFRHTWTKAVRERMTEMVTKNWSKRPEAFKKKFGSPQGYRDWIDRHGYLGPAGENKSWGASSRWYEKFELDLPPDHPLRRFWDSMPATRRP